MMLKFIAMLLASHAAAQAQTYNISGDLNGLPGGDYRVTGTATLGANGAYTITGNLTPATAQQCTTITAPNGSLTDSNGAVWTWGVRTGSGNNWYTLRNGQSTQLAGIPGEIAAVTMSLRDGTIYNRHFSGEWRMWTPQGWLRQTGAPSGC